MNCCLPIIDYLSIKFNIYRKKFDIFLDEILEIKHEDKKEEKVKLNMEEINKDEDHVIIDMPINKGYELI